MQPFLIFLGIIFVLFLLGLLESEREKRHPVVREYRALSKTLPAAFSGYRVLFLTDLHGSFVGKDNRRLNALIQKQSFDLVLIGGDMLTVKEWMKEADIQSLEKLLSALPEGVPVYYAYGNHESRLSEKPALYPGWEEQLKALSDRYGVRILRTERAFIEKDGARIAVSSFELPHLYYGKGRRIPLPVREMEEALGTPEPFEILLLHSPLYFSEAAEWGAELTLSGHFHGGTIGLGPLGGFVSPQFQFFSKLCRGKHVNHDRTGIVSAGLGTHSVSVRVFNPPEIVLITLENDE